MNPSGELRATVDEVAAEARKALEQLRAAHPNAESVFVRKNGRPVRDFRKAWKSAVGRGELKDKRFYGLRRGVTTNLAEAGVPEQTAMAFTGHKDIATHRRYRQLLQANLVNAARQASNPDRPPVKRAW